MEKEIIKPEKKKLEANEYYESLISPISVSHLEKCNCQEEKLKELEAQELTREREDLIRENLINNSVVAEHRFNLAKEKAKVKLVKELREKNVRCSVERQIISRDIEIFAGKYDLTDARAYMIVENILSLKLSAHRLALHSTLNEPVQSVIDREGNLTYKLNPAEKAKMDYNNSIIAGIKELNLIFEGSKNININLNKHEIIDMDTLFGKDIEDDKTITITEVK